MKIFEQRLAEKKLALNLNIEENLPEMMLDAFKIEQMMINLIDNAIKYTDEGEINISVFLNNNKLRIIVRDTGIGIPKDKAERVFERFFTVDKSRSRKLGGTGLGLSIVKHIVILHGGEIKVSEAPVKGAVFTIELPVIR
jgi:two-component system phosphate regulon sensor histidine kinase PhoR